MRTKLMSPFSKRLAPIFAIVACTFQPADAEDPASLEASPQTSLADSSPTEHGIVFVSDSGSQGRDLFHLPDSKRDGNRISSYEGRGHYPHFNWPASSGTGDWIAYMTDTDGHDRYAVWVSRPDGSDTKRLTPKRQEAFYPSWSNDGTRIAFSGRVSGVWQLFVVQRDGSNLEQVSQFSRSSAPSWGARTTWAADDQSIVFDSDHTDDWSLYTFDLGTGTRAPLGSSPVQGRCPAFSPDQKQLAFVSKRDGGTRIWVSSVDGTHARSLGVFTLGHSTPAWSPDGKRIAFSAMTNESGPDLFTVLVEGGEGKYEELYSSPGYDAFPCWVR